MRINITLGKWSRELGMNTVGWVGKQKNSLAVSQTLRSQAVYYNLVKCIIKYRLLIV